MGSTIEPALFARPSLICFVQWHMDCLTSPILKKSTSFHGCGIYVLAKRWQKYAARNNTLYKSFFILFSGYMALMETTG